MKGSKWRFFPREFGAFPYIFLIYLLFPFFSLLSETGIKQTLGYAMLFLFLVTYRQLYFSMGKRSFTNWLAVQLSIVFILSLFYHLNYLFLGFFPANFIGWYQDKRKFRLGFASLVIVELFPFLFHLTIMKTIFSTRDFLYLVPFVIIMLISPFGVRSMHKRIELEKQLDQANQQIKELVKRDERVRIARDLHDTLGHTLSLLTLKSQFVQRLTAIDPERARAEAKEMEVTSRAALKQVRELVSDMRAATIAEELLHVQQILKAAGIQYYLEGDPDFSEIAPFTQNIIGMCVREAATNVVKHSGATNCYVRIHQTSDRITVIVQDDGMGVSEDKQYGNGLMGMLERLALIDGTLNLITHNGAFLELIVPIVKKAKVEM